MKRVKLTEEGLYGVKKTKDGIYNMYTTEEVLYMDNVSEIEKKDIKMMSVQCKVDNWAETIVSTEDYKAFIQVYDEQILEVVE